MTIIMKMMVGDGKSEYLKVILMMPMLLRPDLLVVIMMKILENNC